MSIWAILVIALVCILIFVRNGRKDARVVLLLIIAALFVLRVVP